MYRTSISRIAWDATIAGNPTLTQDGIGPCALAPAQ